MTKEYSFVIMTSLMVKKNLTFLWEWVKQFLKKNYCL